MENVLQNPAIAGFERVKTLLEPDAQIMGEEIEVIFSAGKKDDLILLFFLVMELRMTEVNCISLLITLVKKTMEI